ncbi:hypothetical protein ECE50_027220 [Chitinophaga sp. Mgbs1]|uniref:DUF4595 domain-containing protein n=1 Tax=Chitinophaga solisilvae TaxID=1233460 RepID=A0A9Q5GP50_9BACT|nr:hypothetical protein [Chitinophaga solisilvae]
MKPAKRLLLALSATVFTLAACSKKNNTGEAYPTEPVTDIPGYYISKLNKNDKSSDSFVYNSRGKLIQIWGAYSLGDGWDYAYTDYIYGPDGKLIETRLYNRSSINGPRTLWILRQYKITNGRIHCATSYPDGSGDGWTSSVALNAAGQFSLLGSKDTLPGNDGITHKPIRYLSYRELRYQSSNIHQFVSDNFTISENVNPDYTLVRNNLEYTYGKRPNAMNRLISNDPVLAWCLYERFMHDEYMAFFGGSTMLEKSVQTIKTKKVDSIFTNYYSYSDIDTIGGPIWKTMKFDRRDAYFHGKLTSSYKYSATYIKLQ